MRKMRTDKHIRIVPHFLSALRSDPLPRRRMAFPQCNLRAGLLMLAERVEHNVYAQCAPTSIVLVFSQPCEPTTQALWGAKTESELERAGKLVVWPEDVWGQVRVAVQREGRGGTAKYGMSEPSVSVGRDGGPAARGMRVPAEDEDIAKPAVGEERGGHT